MSPTLQACNSSFSVDDGPRPAADMILPEICYGPGLARLREELKKVKMNSFNPSNSKCLKEASKLMHDFSNDIIAELQLRGMLKDEFTDVTYATMFPDVMKTELRTSNVRRRRSRLQDEPEMNIGVAESRLLEIRRRKESTIAGANQLDWRKSMLPNRQSTSICGLEPATTIRENNGIERMRRAGSEMGGETFDEIE
ncbi:hypothetical protein KSP40_PGU019570 [Platanthera guangdongensis]|uniref:Uncharacterized protein n=1 Tax=Platanthera guangdongensis TaxID=2320717 RepID=A0ABR2LHM4_9ASPA